MRKSRLFYFFGFSILLCFDTITQVGMKLAGEQAMPMDFNLAWLIRVLCAYWMYIALAGYLGSFVTWMILLKYAPVGPSFAAAHMEIVTVTFVSWLFLGEPMTNFKLLGGLLILLGVACLAVERDLKEKREAKEYKRLSHG